MSAHNPEEYPQHPETPETYEGVSPEGYPVDPGQYDPAAALVDENQAYGAPEEAYYDPNQAYADPGQGYVDPAAAYEDPNQAYTGYQEGYTDPGQAYTDPASGYVESNAGYAGYEGYPAPTDGGVYDEAPAPPPVAPRPAAKKKVSKRAPQRKPHAPPAKKRPVPKPVVYGGGLSMMTVFLTVIAMGMLAAVVMIMLPRDMSKVGGYPVNPLAGEKPRNLLAEAQKIMIERNSEFALTEAEVNQYLNQRLQGAQSGPMASLVKFRGVYVDFASGSADIIIERELFGMPITMSARVVAEQTRGRALYKPAGWTLGRVELGERNVKPVIDLFLRLRTACLDEYQAIQQMSDVRFEENRLVLDARI